MQLYLKDGMEIREVQFTNEEVQNYCELLNIKYDHYVPTLMCAKLWPQFELFQSFSKKPIILKETHIKTQHQLQVLSLIHISEPTRRTERSRMPSSA